MAHLTQDTEERLTITSPKDAHERAHNDTVSNIASFPRSDMNAALLLMLNGWNMYAKAFQVQPWNEDHEPIGRDGYAHNPWLEIGQAITQLLAVDSRTGRLNCAKVHSFILETMHANGYTEKETA